MKTERIIEVKHVTYTYPGQITALDDVSFHINKGEKIALLGANGSGKSTMFLCLNGVLRPKKGTISYNGEPISYSKKGLLALRSKLQIVFQDPDTQLFSSSVYQEISFGVLNLKVPEEEARRRVSEVIVKLEMESIKDRPTHFLSGGQKKRVTIADILVMKPEVIIFDEPVSALDPKYTNMVYQIIDDLVTEGITVIISTHDVNHAYEWADRLLVFSEGKVIATGKPEEVFEEESILEQANLTKPFILEVYDTLRRYNKTVTACIPKNRSQLEEILITL